MNFKNEQGITIIILVITVILLAILSATAFISGRQTLVFTKETKFVSELKVVREKANIVKREKELGSTAYDNVGKSISAVSGEALTNIQSAFTACGISSAEQEKYRYYTKLDLKFFGIYDLEQSVLINLENLDIISVEGIEINGQKYYTIESVEAIM